MMVEAALLFEAGFESIFDISILVTAEEGTRIARACSRGAQNKTDIRKRMALQMPETEKRKRADHIIENNGDIQQLRKDCTELWKKIISV
ncbi:MAG: dephospho-CoA kinase [Candidatus Marinimicrobia bacterium]|nr:dephospho-CoA kinase [Candidatus Neomarinimicrobiota bacterium]